ncbi:endonuclease [Luteolibacter sp. Populi]|uniref:endonuclease n=1 Tax=Luteolibacter sp. Populi TaxID=3230487 RepID=UPI003467969F
MAGLLRGFVVSWAAAACCLAGEAYIEKSIVASPHATQAAAADGQFVYAVSSTAIAKLDRDTGKEIAVSTGKASHLNSALILDGKIYSAHSNFPLKPEQGEIRVLDPETMKLELFHRFEEPPGSVTWILKREGSWWCHFAGYGTEKEKSRLLRFDAEWQETGRWDYPADLVKDWGAMSLSGAVWQGDALLATGHDKKLIYRLKLPEQGGTMQWLGSIPSPFSGQGIAADPKTGGLVGIDRKRKAVVFAELDAPAR